MASSTVGGPESSAPTLCAAPRAKSGANQRQSAPRTSAPPVAQRLFLLLQKYNGAAEGGWILFIKAAVGGAGARTITFLRMVR